MEGFDPQAVGREFGLPENAEVVALLAIGYGQEPDKPYGGRLALSEIVHDEHFGRRWNSEGKKRRPLVKKVEGRNRTQSRRNVAAGINRPTTHGDARALRPIFSSRRGRRLHIRQFAVVGYADSFLDGLQTAAHLLQRHDQLQKSGFDVAAIEHLQRAFQMGVHVFSIIEHTTQFAIAVPLHFEIKAGM
jgi:hypothetical protein